MYNIPRKQLLEEFVHLQVAGSIGTGGMMPNSEKLRAEKMKKAGKKTAQMKTVKAGLWLLLLDMTLLLSHPTF